MNAFALFFAVLGVICVSRVIMKFIVWIDGADELECDNEPCEAAPGWEKYCGRTVSVLY